MPMDIRFPTDQMASVPPRRSLGRPTWMPTVPISLHVWVTLSIYAGGDDATSSDTLRRILTAAFTITLPSAWRVYRLQASVSMAAQVYYKPGACNR